MIDFDFCINRGNWDHPVQKFTAISFWLLPTVSIISYKDDGYLEVEFSIMFLFWRVIMNINRNY